MEDEEVAIVDGVFEGVFGALRDKTPMKKKDLIRLDEEVALKLQAEFNEEERLTREKAKKNKKPILP
ncbi:hypothetical protein Tco_0073912 [Tanacetum coccineum]